MPSPLPPVPTLPSVPPTPSPPQPTFPDAQGGERCDVPPETNFSPQGFAPPPSLAHDDQALQLLPGAENLTPWKRFWRKFGGDGFLISVGVHIILIIVAFTWVTATYIINSSKPEDFVTGAGGGNQGDKVSMSEHRIKPKNARNMVKSPTKLVSKSSSSSVSIPDMPNLNMSALQSGSLAGAASKGLGGGAGGGIGTGIGPGRGGGRNMVSLFGVGGFNAPGLTGTLYDVKQTRTGVKQDPGIGGYEAHATNFFYKAHWSEDYLRSRFFAAPDKLAATEFYIPLIPAGAAPKAFNAEGKIAAQRWIAYYKGAVKAPFSGKIRFIGGADDWIAVRWGGKTVLDAGYPPHRGIPRDIKGKPPAGAGASFPYGSRPPMKSSQWLSVTRGTEYQMEVAIGETPGGQFCAVLLFQKDNDKSPLYLFRMTGAPLADRTKMGVPVMESIPSNADLSGGGFVWEPRMARTSR